MRLCVASAGEAHVAAQAHWELKLATAQELVESAGTNPGAVSTVDLEEAEDIVSADPPPMPHELLPNFTSLLFLVVVVLLHLLLWFAQRWSIRARARVKFERTNRFEPERYALVEPHAHQGKADIVTVHQMEEEAFHYSDSEDDVAGRAAALATSGAAGAAAKSHVAASRPACYFFFQRRRFEVYNEADGSQSVRELALPVDWPLARYATHCGLISDDAIQAARTRYGINSLHIPPPTFFELFSRQILGPVPVFQIFCSALWLLDEYWNYALFSMAMICMFEASTAYGRLRNVTTLRSMQQQQQGASPASASSGKPLWAYRGEQWVQLASHVELLPGDLFSLATTQSDSQSQAADGAPPQPSSSTKMTPAPSEASLVAPCDAVLISGSAVVNEATLTGESTPQMKEAIATTAEEETTGVSEPLDIESLHRTHVLYAGTSIMQLSRESEEETESPGAGRPRAPDNGVVCVCLRTGFSSSQGKLVRLIESSTEQVSGDAKEAVALLSVLLAFALVASGYVLYTGLQSGKRSQYELVLRCVLILTAVVPPELPMQTAVAVNTALLALWRAQVFCTEPFRIPYAGKIDVCAFDKTGTLTTDQLAAVGTVSLRRKKGRSPEADNDDNEEEEEDSLLAPMSTTDTEIAAILASCHSLVSVNGKLVGDPIETAAIAGVRWNYDAQSQLARPVGASSVPLIASSSSSSEGTASSARVLHRYHFSSALQRMGVLVELDEGRSSGEKRLWSFVKGSPEIINELCSANSQHQERLRQMNLAYRQLAERGMRVLALARRVLSDQESKEIRRVGPTHAGNALSRDSAETGLEPVGLVAFSCLVRKDTTDVLRRLSAAANRLIMVTGDAALTALHVAYQTGIAVHEDRQCSLILTIVPEEEEQQQLNDEQVSGDLAVLDALPMLRWMPAYSSQDQSMARPYVAEEIEMLAAVHNLVVTGPALQIAARRPDASIMWNNCDCFSVFARMTPGDKESVVRALLQSGHFVLMCGDGANDVGALKLAHVGLALLSGFGAANTAKDGEKEVHEESEEERVQREATIKQRQTERAALMAEEAKKDRAELSALQQTFFKEETERLEREGASWIPLKALKAATSRLLAEQKRRQAARAQKYGVSAGASGIAAQAALMASDMDGMDSAGGVPVVKLGDASVAAPFTSKLPSIKSTLDIIRQGRCTLVSTIQNMQILTLNCLVSAYSLSALYIDGIRFGEAQMIATGLLLAVAGIAFSYARPVDKLAPVRPITSVFHPAVSVSTIGQLLIHLACMVYVVQLAKAAAHEDSPLYERVISSEARALELMNQEPTGFWADVQAQMKLWDTTTPEEAEERAIKPFKPSLLNTVVFLVETAQQVSVMAINYRGRPFMLSATENVPMMLSLLACGAGTFIAGFEVYPELNERLRLVEIPTEEFRQQVLICLFASVLGAMIWDRLITAIFARRLVFAGYRDAWEALPTLHSFLYHSAKYTLYTFAGLFLLGTGNIFLWIGAYFVYKRFVAPAPPQVVRTRRGRNKT